MDNNVACEWCGSRGKLMRCARCRSAFYCNRDHQCQDWEKHKRLCRLLAKQANDGVAAVLRGASETQPNPNNSISVLQNSRGGQNRRMPGSTDIEASRNTSPITFEGSSENEILTAQAETLNPTLDFRDVVQPPQGRQGNGINSLGTVGLTKHQLELKDLSEIRLDNEAPFLHKYDKVEHDIIEKVYKDVVKDMDRFGVCVVDEFLGLERGSAVLKEVIDMYEKGFFKDGKLVNNRVNADLKTIRGDQIMWIDGKESSCKNIGMLISIVDAIIMKANRLGDNSKMSTYNINGRTKAMVACYPGHGSQYVKHVDNPNRDGRCITAIYYLNRGWDVRRNGGLLRIFPEGWQDQVADIEPLFDRILFFWSDRRNPHEVQPAFETRYAITLWYFDAAEREEACRRYERESEYCTVQTPFLTLSAFCGPIKRGPSCIFGQMCSKRRKLNAAK